MSNYGARRSHRHSPELSLSPQKTFSIERPIANDQLQMFDKIAWLIIDHSTRQSEAVPAPKKLVILEESGITKLFRQPENLRKGGIRKIRDDLALELGRKSTGQGMRLWTQGLNVTEEIIDDEPWYDLSLQLEAGKIFREQDIILGAIRKIGGIQGELPPNRNRDLLLGRFSSPPDIELIREIRSQIPRRFQVHLAATRINSLGLSQLSQASLAS